jgi:hypothetical protein
VDGTFPAFGESMPHTGKPGTKTFFVTIQPHGKSGIKTTENADKMRKSRITE